MFDKLHNYGVGILTTFIMLVCLDVGGGLLLDLFARDRFLGMWLETKQSKAELLRNEPIPPDFVLVGSSRTEFHFNTEAMSKSGLRFFNFGAPGLEYEDLIYPVIRSARHARRGVIFSVPIGFLAEPLSCPKWPTPEEIEFLKKKLQKRCDYRPFAARTLLAIRNWYRPALDYVLSRDRFDRLMQREYGTRIRLASSKARRISYVRRFAHGGVIVTFDNGDAQMITDGARVPIVPASSPRATRRLRPEKLALLRAFKDYLAAKGLLFIVNIERETIMREPDFTGGIEGLRGLNYMVMNDIHYPRDMWADPWHLNGRGAARHSTVFVQRLNRLLGRQGANAGHRTRRLPWPIDQSALGRSQEDTPEFDLKINPGNGLPG